MIETIIQNRGLAAHMLLQRLCYVDEGKETQKLTKVALSFQVYENPCLISKLYILPLQETFISLSPTKCLTFADTERSCFLLTPIRYDRLKQEVFFFIQGGFFTGPSQ